MAGCQIHSLSPQIPYIKTHTTSNQQHSTNYYFPYPQSFLILRPTITHLNEQQLQIVSTATTKQTKIPKPPDANSVKFKTLGDCKLGISRYPDFVYNAEGGQGSGTATRISEHVNQEDEVSVDFDVKTLYIPPLSTATTKFLGLPLPPFLKIDIVPDAFRGIINQESGKVELKFRAKFLFSIGSVYKARPLLVDTVLTSEESKGEIRGGRGMRMDKDGMCKLVGVARVEPINDIFMDTFLSLPTECLASLNAMISFSTTTA